MEIKNIKNKLFNLENLSTDESLFLFEDFVDSLFFQVFYFKDFNIFHQFTFNY